MTKKIHPIVALIAVFTFSITVQAQDKEDKEENRLNGGSTTVVKPYDPTISDAFKVKSKPRLNDTIQLKKKPVTYSIFSVPVASTFTPATGKLSRLKREPRPEYYDNYARLGVGNYVNIIGEFAAGIELDRDSDVGVFLNHFSTQGGIEEAVLDDTFSTTSLDLSYNKRGRNSNWGITAGGNYQAAQWYGVPLETAALIVDPDDIDAPTNYLSYGLGSNLKSYDGVLKNVEVLLKGVSSNNDASEFRIMAQPQLVFNVLDEEISLGATVDYLSGSFETQGLLPAAADYTYLKGAVNPSINLYGDNFKAQIGTTIAYLSDTENSESELFVYPDINASYTLYDEVIVAYASVGGGLDMNNLSDMSRENPFLAPAVTIAPTSRQIDAQLGIKGKFSRRFGYKVYGGYELENDRYFYTKSPAAVPTATTEAFNLGNTFSTQYGDLNTIELGAAIMVDVNTQLELTLDGVVKSYKVDDGDDFNNVASQLPELMVTFNAGYQITDKWHVGSTLYYVGEREVWSNSITGIGSAKKISDYLDLNLDVNYKINDKLSAFLRGNNLTGGNYQFYKDYAVQNFQVMGGAIYKFDF